MSEILKWENRSPTWGFNWISVKEKMPQKNITILFTDGEDTYAGELRDGYWIVPEVYNDNGFTLPLSSITYWMKLPTPPKEETNNE